MNEHYSDQHFDQAPNILASPPPQAPPAQGKPEPKTKSTKFRFTAVGELQWRPPEFLIDGVLETEALAMIFGEPGCGKSFLAVDMALCIATGQDFHGRPTKQGPVFFIAGEGHNGLARRFHAWALERGESLENVPLFKSDCAAQFLDNESAKSVALAIDELAKKYGKPALIVIDTVARNFGNGDENDTRAMSEFVNAMDKLKTQFEGCSILLVHHCGHTAKTRARGSMALKGALDCEYSVTKKGDSLNVSNTKMKDAPTPLSMPFKFKTIELGPDANSAILVASERPNQASLVTGVKKFAIETYIFAAVHDGFFKGRVFGGLPLEPWRKVFYAKHTADTTEAKRKSFERVRKSLVELGILAVNNDVYFTKDAGVISQIVQQRDSGTTRDNGGTRPA